MSFHCIRVLERQFDFAARSAVKVNGGGIKV